MFNPTDSRKDAPRGRKPGRFGAAILGALLLSLGGCGDLDVTNPNLPDRERALSQPEDIQSIVSGAYGQLFNRIQHSNPGLGVGAMSDALTGGFADYGVQDISMEPRAAWNNSPLYNRRWMVQDTWGDLYRSISAANDGLAAIADGIAIEVPEGGRTIDRTRRLQAWGRLVQGVGYGYLAMLFDQAPIVDESTDLETSDPSDFRPWTEVADAAIGLLDEGIAIAATDTFSIPGDVSWINGMAMDAAGLARIMNSYAARILAYTPRTPAERAAVDWEEVIRRVDAGIRVDLAPLGLIDAWESDARRIYGRVRARPGDHVRPDYYALGTADVSGAFQSWHATPSADRMPFRIDTPDRRIRGAEGLESPGLYFHYDTNDIWAADRGTYRYSHYYFSRSGVGTTWSEGPQPTMTVAEMDLLKAEALIRLGRAEEAVPLINATRVGNGGLPPVTVAGPPEDAACVPRKVVSGACGSLWDALMHEKRLEMNGVELAVSWWDARGWGTLQAGTPVHLPVPGAELETLGLPLYTFGGALAGSAAPPTWDACPAGVTLPRC